MSRISGYLTPEARAGWEAVSAKWAAPGMCNPTDDMPTVTGTPSDEAVNADVRTTAQREPRRVHRDDALCADVR